MAVSNEILFGRVPVEIWALVIDIIRWESWMTLPSLNLSCRDLHEIVAPVLFRALHILFPRRKQRLHNVQQDTRYERLHELLEPSSGIRIQPYIRFLAITGYIGSLAEDYVETLQKLVKRLPNLESLRWRGISIPPRLFGIIEEKKGPLLHYEGRAGPLVESGVVDLPSARFIKSLNITYGVSLRNKDSIDISDLVELVLSLPNLERLVLKYSPEPKKGCAPRPIFGVPPGSSLPPLQVLCLANFAFSAEQAAAWARSLAQRQTLRRLDLDGATAYMTGLIDHLSDTPDAISGLRSLWIRIHDATWASNIARVTSSLERLLRQITHLRAFSGHDLPKEALHAVVEQHGTTGLRKLRWRQTWFPLLDYFFAGGLEENSVGVQRSKEKPNGHCIFSPEELRELGARLPNVERLGVDLCFRKSSNPSFLSKVELPHAHLGALASFPGLKYLELNMPLHNRTVVEAVEAPWLDESVTEDAFRYVAAQSARRVQLAVKGYEWESFAWDTNGKDRRWKPFAFVCWRESTSSQSQDSRIHRTRLDFHSPWRLSFIEQSKFEQAMEAAGLLEGEGLLAFGPRIC